MTKSHGNYGKKVHRSCSSCISSIEKLTETPLSSPCQLRLGVDLSCHSLRPYNLIVLLFCLYCHNNIINKGCSSFLIDYILEEVIYHSLESSRGVGESEVYDCRLIYFYMYCKGCLPFISFLDPNIVISSP